MRVICIQSSHSTYPDAILVHKGSIYHVTEVIKGKRLVGTENDIWYKVLETGEGNVHHSSLFALAVPEKEEEEKNILSLSSQN